MSQLLRNSPGLLAWVGIFVIATFVFGIIGIMMSRSGTSLRPVYWMAGFLLLVGAPQFLAHLAFAIAAVKRDAPRVAAMEQLFKSDNLEARRDAAKLLFGPDAHADLVADARRFFSQSMADAEAGQFASLPTGETVLLAKFKGYTGAEKAWVQYLRETGLNQLGGKGDSQRGFAVTRPVGDRAYALHMGNMLGVWTGPNDAAIRQRMLAGGFKIPSRAPLDGAGAIAQNGAKSSRSGTSPVRMAAIAGGVAIYLLLVVAYFFKGAAWASGAPAKPGVVAVNSEELAVRLESINQLDVPFRIEKGEKPNEFFATWRYADAKWIDLARARGIKRTFRIRLTLDESAKVVRATDYISSYDWSVGRGGADIQWKASSGIVFFQKERMKVLGLQLDQSGMPKPELSYSYNFDLMELKEPVKAIITEAGWDWRPVVWQGPKSLRWLTE